MQNSTTRHSSFASTWFLTDIQSFFACDLAFTCLHTTWACIASFFGGEV